MTGLLMLRRCRGDVVAETGCHADAITIGAPMK